jgi:hypothetical protein
MTQRIQVLWDNDEKTIIRWDFKGAWTWEDWYTSVNHALELRATVIEHPIVPAIFNLKSSGTVPMGALPHARSAMEMMDQRDYVILANTSGFVRSLTEIFRVLNAVFAEKVYLARTVEDARALIAARRADGEPF